MAHYLAGGRKGRRLAFESLEQRALLAAVLMSVEEQLLVEMINRARSDPAAEAARYGIDLNEGLNPGTISPTPKQPLAPHQLLVNAARGHSQDMIDRNFFSHTNPDGQNPRDRMVAAGYTPTWWGENIADGYWDEYAMHEGWFLSPGHRRNILLDNFREVGVGMVFSDFGFYGYYTGTEAFGSRNGNAFLTGVAFSDQRLADNFLTYGESLADVTITAQKEGSGATYSTTTGPAGGYSLQLPAGTYDLKAEGGGLPQAIYVADVAIGAQNVKVDFIVPHRPPPMDPYEVNNSIATATQLGYGDQTLSHLTIHDAYDDDYFAWTAHQDGTLTVETDLQRDVGDPELMLFDAAGDSLQYGTWTPEGWSVTWDVHAGESYVICVTPGGDAMSVHRDYDLRIDGPGGTAPAADDYEPNDDFATAARLGTGDRTVTGLTAHVPSDRDVFSWQAVATGPVVVELLLAAPADGLQLLLYDAQRQVLDQSTESGTTRTVAAQLVAGDAVFVVVQAGARTLVSDYSLQIDGVLRPVAADDRGMTEPQAALEVNLLTNDHADAAQLVAGTLQVTSSPQHGQVQASAVEGRVVYTPAADFLGVDRFTYVISDDRGNTSAPATVEITVLNPADKPWQNPLQALDVNADGFLSPLDALLIINRLTREGPGPLGVPSAATDFPLPYYDVNGDGFVTPIDALQVINRLTSPGNGEGEEEGEDEGEAGKMVTDIDLHAAALAMQHVLIIDPSLRTHRRARPGWRNRV